MKNKRNVYLSSITSKEMRLAVPLYESAFPPIERRNTDDWIRLWQEDLRFHVDAIKCSDVDFVGFISYWTFADFVYVEHFAIEPKQRGHNFGGNAIDAFIEKIDYPIILEVECPTDSIARRRINFYQKHGLSLIEEDYLQPPYQEGYEWFPLLIMSSQLDFAKMHFKSIVDTIHTHVYNVKSK